MSMADDQRIFDRVEQLRPKELTMRAIWDKERTVWLAYIEYARHASLGLGTPAAEGSSLKEALMNLADKISV